MKLAKSILIIATAILLASCAPIANRTDNVSITLPMVPSSQQTHESRDAGQGESALFIVTVTDKAGVVQTKRGMSGDTLTFELPLGEAKIDALAYADELQTYVSLLGTDATIGTTRTYLQKADTDFWSGTTNHTVVDGAQTVTLTLNKTAFVDKTYLAAHEGISFYKDENNNYIWSYPTYNLSGSEMLSAFCYDKNGNFITAKQNDANGNNSRIEVYKPVSEDDSYIYSEDSKTVYTLAAGIIPQRMTSSGNVIYFITNKYGARDDGNNTVWYFDDTGTPATVTPESFAVADFDIVTALLYDHGTLYFAGEKRGQPTEIDFALNDDDDFDFPSTLYSSTYSVTQYLIKDDGTPDTSTKSTYLSYTDDDIILKILSKVDEDDKEYIAVPYNDWDNKYKNVYLYNSISDLGVYDGKICGITSSLLSPNDCYADMGYRVSNHGDFAFGSVVYGANSEPEEIIGFDENTAYCRFVAIKPKELDLSYLVVADGGNYRNGIAKINFETETPSIEPDETLNNIDASRNGSGFLGLLSDHLSENGHLYACYFDQSNLVTHDVLQFGKTTANYRWAYPAAGLSSNQTDLASWCYDKYGNFITAQNNESTSQIIIYVPQAASGRYTYYPVQMFMKSFNLPAGQIPQRITSAGKYVYYITNKYGERDKGNNKVYYFDMTTCAEGQTITPEIHELTFSDFDVVTALVYDRNSIYVAGEKRGTIESTLTTPNGWPFPKSPYNSTYSVYQWNLNDDGTIDTESKSPYLTYTDQDMMNEVRLVSQTDFAKIMGENDVNYNYGCAYIYGSISDLTEFEGEILAIRNMLVVRNTFDTLDASGNAASIKNRQDYMFGDIVKRDYDPKNHNVLIINKVMDFGMDSPKNSTSNPIPCRFIAIVPGSEENEKKLYVSLLTDSNYGNLNNKEMGVITFVPYNFTFSTDNSRSSSSHMLDFIAYRTSSFFACFDEFFGNTDSEGFNFSNSVHLFWVNDKTNP